MTNLKNSQDVVFEVLISNFSELREFKELKKTLSGMQNSFPIHVWDYDPGLPEENNQLIREIFIQGLVVDEILILDLFESRHHIPISIKKYCNIPTSVILYDLIPLEDPETYLSNTYASQIYNAAILDLQQADRIFCISKYTLVTLIKNFELLASKAIFIGGAANSTFRVQKVQEKMQLIAILGDDPRKNVSNLTTAWANMPPEILQKYTLKIVGKFSSERINFYLRSCGLSEVFKDKLFFTGEISEHDLELELNRSIALVHPAVSEGLGLPILEAITLGIPAICSNTTSMSEIGAKGAIFDPRDIESIEQALKKIIGDVIFQNEVALSQQKILKSFNWDYVCKVLCVELGVIPRSAIAKFPNSPEDSEPAVFRIAVIGPSKYAKTGVSRFVEFLMPFMRNETLVDFLPSESLDNLEESIKILDSFDQVLIHLGNSPHHKNAFNIAANYPAVVFCHDVKFGNTLKDLHRHNPKWMSELKEILPLEQDQFEIRSLVRILNLALGVVVQSESARDFLYLAGIPESKILCLTHPYLLNQKVEKKFISLEEDLDEIVSAGFVTPNKLYEELIEGVSILNFRLKKSFKLKLLGEADVYYAAKLKSLAEDFCVSLEISGYLDNDEYLSNLRGSGLAIQLRSLDSGEASGVISDLLFFGVPTILNHIGSFIALPSAAVVKMPAKPSPTDIACAIEQTLDQKVRQDLSTNCQIFSVLNSSPEHWSKELITFINHRYNSDLIHNLRRSSRIIHKTDILRISRACKSMEKMDIDFGYRFLIASDVTTLKSTKFISGIQRATLEIHSALRTELSANRFLLGQVDFEFGSHREKTLQSEIRDDVIVSGSIFDPQQIDALLLLDLNFNYFHSDDFSKVIKRNVPVITNVYDILPISNPEWFPPGTSEKLFTPWIDSVLKFSSDVIVNSYATLAELQSLKQFSSFKGHVHVAPLGIPRDFKRVPLEREQFRTLLVGTIEPRKGHEDALDAFDQLHARGIPVELHIVGRQGWMVESVIERITNHSHFNKMLFWHKNCSDQELTNLYGTSRITLITSKGEGFGLPLIEALSQGSKVIARDIPVFREIGQQGAIFFDQYGSKLVDVWLNALCDDSHRALEPILEDKGYRDYARLLKTILTRELDW